MKVTTSNYQETQKLGSEFAKKIRGGEVIALVGELGAGKTTFVQGLAKGIGIKRRVISPTFIIMREYKIKNKNSKVKITNQKSKIRTLYHMDLYRLEENLEGEIKNLGLTDIWRKPENIVVIEWAEKIKKLIPKDAIWIKFRTVDENGRKITFYENS